MTEQPLKVHITGVNGLIGNVVYRHLCQFPERYDVYGSARRREPSLRLAPEDMATVPEDHFFLADLSDAPAMQAAIAGMDAVLHIGAVADEYSPWEPILQANIIGTHNVLEACRLAGVKRLVFASSARVNMGTFMYEEPFRTAMGGIADQTWTDIQPLNTLAPTRPGEDYGASKVWGEASCRVYADRDQMGVICIRVGGVQRDDTYDHPFFAAGWCSHRDIANFFRYALEATAQPCYEIVYGFSDNRYRIVDLEHTRQVLSYWPQDGAVWPPPAQHE